MLITTVHKCEALTKLDFPGTPVVKIPCYQCKDRFDPWLKNKDPTCHSLVQFSCSVVSYSLRPHGLQRARPSCPSPTPGVYANSCPLSWWCHPTISSRFKKKWGGDLFESRFYEGSSQFSFNRLFLLQRRSWEPIPIFLPGESYGQRSLMGYSPWDCKESDTTKVTEHTCTHHPFASVWQIGIIIYQSSTIS